MKYHTLQSNGSITITPENEKEKKAIQELVDGKWSQICFRIGDTKDFIAIEIRRYV